MVGIHLKVELFIIFVMFFILPSNNHKILDAPVCLKHAFMCEIL